MLTTIAIVVSLLGSPVHGICTEGQFTDDQCAQVGTAIDRLIASDDPSCRKLGAGAAERFGHGEIQWDPRYSHGTVTEIRRTAHGRVIGGDVSEGTGDYIWLTDAAFDSGYFDLSLQGIIAHEEYHLEHGDHKSDGPGHDHPGSPAYLAGERCK